MLFSPSDENFQCSIWTLFPIGWRSVPVISSSCVAIWILFLVGCHLVLVTSSVHTAISNFFSIEWRSVPILRSTNAATSIGSQSVMQSQWRGLPVQHTHFSHQWRKLLKVRGGGHFAKLKLFSIAKSAFIWRGLKFNGPPISTAYDFSSQWHLVPVFQCSNMYLII